MTLDALWYSNRHQHPLIWLLMPLTGLYCAVVRMRRLACQHHLLSSYRASEPVIVVGNLSVGGTGKTPLVIWLARFLRQQGFQPGIISRGYGGQSKKRPQQVYADSDPHLVGDEPVLLARHSGCPVAVAPRRWQAVELLRDQQQCNLFISDDGLQHYALQRDIEIAVIDGHRRFGNGHCLPSGPLREPLSRLNSTHFRVTRGGIAQPGELAMHYAMQPLHNISDSSLTQPLSRLRDEHVHAVAGIGNPSAFFDSLRAQGMIVQPHPFPDHHVFQPLDILFGDTQPVVMTEKDAVKCRLFAEPHHWYLPIEAQLPDDFGHQLLHLLERRLPHEQTTA